MKVLSFLLAIVSARAVALSTDLDRAMFLVYSQEFAAGAQAAAVVSEREARDPLAPAVAASALLFGELDRLELLKDSGKGAGNSHGAGKPRGARKPDTAIRQRMAGWVRETLRRAERRDSAEAWTALMMAHGVERDYFALVEKSYRQSWVHAKQAQEYALKLVAHHPEAHDAWFTLGFHEYLIANAPFVFRPFMKLEQADGDRRRAIRHLELAAAQGRYLRGFAQMILASAYRKEGRRADADRMLQTLAREYPQNGAIRKEAGAPAGF